MLEAIPGETPQLIPRSLLVRLQAEADRIAEQQEGIRCRGVLPRSAVRPHRRDPGYLGFLLARRLRAVPGADDLMVSGNVRIFDPIVEPLARRLGVSADALYIAMDKAWPTIRKPGSLLTEIFELAVACPIKLLGPLARVGAHCRTVLTMAHYFCLQDADGECVLPRKDLGLLLDVTPQYVGNHVRTGVAAGLLDEVDDTYSYRQGIAKVYAFLFACPHYLPPEESA